MFEIYKTDLAGRIGSIQTNHGKVMTPAYVPVIHPVKQTIPAREIRGMGFDMIITNAYITRNRYGDEAVRRGIHGITDFDGSVMTDSGGYQVLEYGDLSVKPSEMAEFERGIMTDIAIPLDRPTGFGLPLKKAESYVSHTLKVSRQTLKDSIDNGQIWVGPIQGGEHFDLVARSTRGLVRAGFQMLALGSPVEFMEAYQYKLLAQMIVAAKRNMPHSVPLHLFGAGHPLTIPLAVALGCDTFDSASYILYAKQNRYITDDGTRNLDEISVFPCGCRICTSHTPAEMRLLDPGARTDALARHNLHAIGLEVDRTRQAIHEGRLWEYVMKKARAHPRLFEASEVLTGNCDLLSTATPRFKTKAVFLYGREDQFRPEVVSYHEVVRRFKSKKDILLVVGESGVKPGYLSPQYARLKKDMADFDSVQVCQYNPILGLIPIEISDIFPAAHHETARVHFEPTEFQAFADTWRIFLENNKFSELRYDGNDEFLRYYARTLPDGCAENPL